MLLAMLLLAALLQAAPAPRVLDSGDQSNMDDARHSVVRTAAELNALSCLHAPERQQPSVNFATEMVIGVFMGSRRTAGYSLEIVGSTENAGTLVVRYREAPPPRGMMTAQVVTSPYHLVTVSFFPGDVKFEKVQP